MMPIALTPRRRREDRRACDARKDRKAAKCARGMAKELDFDPIAPRGVLIEWEQDDVAGGQPIDE